mmetsp:Transcript_24414/g.55033  ORF Transcript_24414/g.55033 Transcript_24414/m.55033 type:complete len:88 (-) Transcript_24414:782-1045(-)
MPEPSSFSSSFSSLKAATPSSPHSADSCAMLFSTPGKLLIRVRDLTPANDLGRQQCSKLTGVTGCPSEKGWKSSMSLLEVKARLQGK